MKKFYLGSVLVLIFLAALVADWNTRQDSVQNAASSMIESRQDDIMEIEFGYPGDRIPPDRSGRLSEYPGTVEIRAPSSTGTGTPDRAGRGEGTGIAKERGGVFHYYRVKEGDTLSEIAERLLGTTTRMGEILRLNRIANPDVLKPGTTLKIPKNRP